MRILGLGGLQHDAACAVLKDGRIAAAVEQEKIARRSTPGLMPGEAIALALELAKVRAEEIDCVAIAAPVADYICGSVRDFRTRGSLWWSITRRMRRRLIMRPVSTKRVC